MGAIKEGMQWPPMDLQRYKIKEHACWYSGDPEILANFYADNDMNDYFKLTHGTRNKNSFWRRQIKNHTDFFIHVPIANDIAETSAAFLFGESPLIRFTGDGYDDNSQEELDKMLTSSGFFSKLLEGAETASAVGGVFIKLCWDTDISPYPIPVVVQPEDVFPEIKFGKLVGADILAGAYCSDEEPSIVYRLFERYEKGKIEYRLYQGSSDRLGKEVPLTAIDEYKDLVDGDKTPDILCLAYIPNMLPNRLERRSVFGRSDLQGIESLMDALDETFSDWMADIQLAKGKIHIPADYLQKKDNEYKFNVDKMMYVEIDADPTALNEKLTATQFAIRSAEYEQTVLNLLDRIITSAGYSPQSFGLNISGRAESGTALNVRERKSFATTAKKQAYWEEPIKHLVKAMVAIYNEELGGHIVGDVETITVEFVDSVSNNLTEVSNAIKALSDAQAISTETKVRMAHPEWSDSQVEKEVQAISSSESAMFGVPNPDDNPDMAQLQNELAQEEEAEI